MTTHEPDAKKLAALLAEVYRTDGAVIWLLSPHPLLDGDSAAELWADGQHERVLAVAEALVTGSGE